jgi:hypothetical protein
VSARVIEKCPRFAPHLEAKIRASATLWLSQSDRLHLTASVDLSITTDDQSFNNVDRTSTTSPIKMRLADNNPRTACFIHLA